MGTENIIAIGTMENQTDYSKTKYGEVKEDEQYLNSPSRFGFRKVSLIFRPTFRILGFFSLKTFIFWKSTMLF